MLASSPLAAAPLAAAPAYAQMMDVPAPVRPPAGHKPR